MASVAEQQLAAEILSARQRLVVSGESPSEVYARHTAERGVLNLRHSAERLVLREMRDGSGV